MGIKWDNICPVVSGTTNEILLCKGKKVFKNGKLLFVGRDRSEDKTQEVLDAVIHHLLNRIARSDSQEKKVVLEHSLYRLTLEDLRETSA